MPYPQITIKDIAKALNVSVSTVSRALNNSPDLSEGTKRQISEYARLHNYKPNLLALSMKKQESKIIGVILPQMIHHFFSSVLEGIMDVAEKEGFSVMLFRSLDNFEKEQHSVQQLISSHANENKTKTFYSTNPEYEFRFPWNSVRICIAKCQC